MSHPEVNRYRFATSAAAMIVLLLLTTGTLTSASFGAPPEDFGRIQDVPVTSQLQVPLERSVQKLFDEFDQLLKNKDVGSIDVLIQLLELANDGFIQQEGQLFGLRAQIEQRIQAMPVSLKQRYLKRVRFAANNSLTVDLGYDRLENLLDVVRRYPATRAAFVALKAIADRHFDRGQLLLAIAGYQRLLDNPIVGSKEQPSILMRLLLALQQAEQHSAALNTIKKYDSAWRSLLRNRSTWGSAVKQVKIWLDEPEKQQLKVALEQGGDWFQLSSVPAWSVPRGLHGYLSGFSQIHEQLRAERNMARQHGIPFISVFRPALFRHNSKSDSVFVSLGTSVDSLSVVDGKSLWHTPVSSRWSEMFVSLGSIAGMRFQDFPTTVYVDQIQADSGLERLLCGKDRIYKVIEKINIAENDGQRGFSTQPRSTVGSPIDKSLMRQLAAFDVESGKQLWKTDPTIDIRYDEGNYNASRKPSIASVSVKIQCAPLFYDRQLLTLGETKSQLWLLSINPETGKYLWSLSLGIFDKDDSHFIATRQMHKTMKVVNGRLICSVGMGTLVAIDLVERRHLWATHYSQDALERQTAHQIRNGKLGQTEPRVKFLNSWRETQVFVGRTAVILASPESRSLLAFRLIDGKPLWRRKIDNAQQLVETDSGQLLVVSRSAVQSIKPETGQSIWSTVIDAPIGTACVAREQILVPLETGHVVSIKTATGEKRQSTLRSSIPLGNLTFANNAVFSQTMTHVSKHVLVRNERNVVSVAGDQVTLDTIRLAIEQKLWNEVRAQLGTFSQTKPRLPLSEFWDILAVELRHADSLETAAIHEFDSWKAKEADSYEKQKLISEEFERRGQLDKAGSIWQELANDLNASQAMFSLSPLHRVSVGRWALTKLAESKGQAGEMISLLPANEQQQKHRFLGEQFKLLRQAEHSDAGLYAGSLRELAHFMENYSYPFDAMAYRQQADRRQGILNRSKRSKNLAPLAKNLPWPIKFDSKKAVPAKFKRDQSQRGHWTLIPVHSLEGTLPNRMTFWLNGKRDQIRFDSIHHSGTWTLELPKSKQTSGSRLPILRGWAIGHLLLVQMGSELITVSAFNERGEPHASVIWHQTLADKTEAADQAEPVAWMLDKPRIGWGPPSVTFLDRFDFIAGRVGPVTANYICYRNAGTLVALSPLTGQPLWERKDVATDTKIIGDENKIALISAEGQSQIILRSFDGKKIAQHQDKVRYGDIVKSFGMNVVTVGSYGSTTTLSCTDMESGSMIWERQLNNDQISFDWSGENSWGNEQIGLFDEQGWLTAIDGRTGETLFRQQIEKQSDATNISAFSDPYHNYIIVSSTPKNIQDASLQKGRLGLRTVVSSGRLYAISKSTWRLLWTRDLHEQGLPLDQPPEAPFLLSLYLRHQNASDKLSEANEWHFECIDKLTGATLVRSKSRLRERRISYHWESRNSSGIKLHFADQYVHFPLTNK